MPPTEKNEPTSGKFILFQRGCRRGKSKVFQEKAPHLEADLQRLGDYWREMKSSSMSCSFGEKGEEIREEEASAGILRRLTMTHKTPHRSTVAMWPSTVPDWLWYTGPSGAHPVPCLQPCLPGRQHSRNAGAALLTCVELGRGGQCPGGRQGGLRAQCAGQEGRRATWEGWGRHTHQSWSTTAASRLYLFTHTPPAPTCSEDTHRRTYWRASGVTLGMEGGSDHTRSLAEAGQV